MHLAFQWYISAVNNVWPMPTYSVVCHIGKQNKTQSTVSPQVSYSAVLDVSAPKLSLHKLYLVHLI